MKKNDSARGTAASLGEDGVIELVRLAAGGAGGRIVAGIGDDAAVISSPGAGTVMLLTTDTVVQGTHFDFAWASPYQVGWKAAAAAVSDVGAMGGRPVAAVVSVSLTGREKRVSLEGLTAGLKAAAVRYGFALAGGDTVRTGGPLTITVTVLGEAAAGRVAMRKGARPGDALLIAGYAGASAAGLEALRRKGKGNVPKYVKNCIDLHLAPEPRVTEGAIAAATGAVSAMMDLSDGLGADLPRMCAASCVGAVVRADAVPVHPDAARACGWLGLDASEVAVAGGEDYNLLIAAPRERAGDLARALNSSTGCPVSIAGEFTERGEGISLVRGDGKRVAWPGAGFSHF